MCGFNHLGADPAAGGTTQAQRCMFKIYIVIKLALLRPLPRLLCLAQGRASWYGGPESFQSNFANRAPPPNYGFGNILYGSCGYFGQVRSSLRYSWYRDLGTHGRQHSHHSTCLMLRPRTLNAMMSMHGEVPYNMQSSDGTCVTPRRTSAKQ